MKMCMLTKNNRADESSGSSNFQPAFQDALQTNAYLILNSGLQKHKVCEIIPLSLCYSPNQAEQESNTQSTSKQGRNTELAHLLSNFPALMRNHKIFLSSNKKPHQQQAVELINTETLREANHI